MENLKLLNLFEGSLSPLTDQNGHVMALRVVDPHRHKRIDGGF